MKRKQFVKGMTQLTQEGAVQVFRQPDVIESFVVGVVGACSSKCSQYRLKQEYGVDILMHHAALQRRPLGGRAGTQPQSSQKHRQRHASRRHQGPPACTDPNEWQLNWVKERNPGVEFLAAPPNAPASSRPSA